MASTDVRWLAPEEVGISREVVLTVLAALLILTLAERRERLAPQRVRRAWEPPRARSGKERSKAGAGLAGIAALAGTAAATTSCLGELLAPALAPVWFTLLGVGFATLPAALAAPSIERRWKQMGRSRGKPAGRVRE